MHIHNIIYKLLWRRHTQHAIFCCQIKTFGIFSRLNGTFDILCTHRIPITRANTKMLVFKYSLQRKWLGVIHEWILNVNKQKDRKSGWSEGKIAGSTNSVQFFFLLQLCEIFHLPNYLYKMIKVVGPLICSILYNLRVDSASEIQCIAVHSECVCARFFLRRSWFTCSKYILYKWIWRRYKCKQYRHLLIRILSSHLLSSCHSFAKVRYGSWIYRQQVFIFHTIPPTTTKQFSLPVKFIAVAACHR